MKHLTTARTDIKHPFEPPMDTDEHRLAKAGISPGHGSETWKKFVRTPLLDRIPEAVHRVSLPCFVLCSSVSICG